MIVMNLARTLKYTDNPSRDSETRGSALPLPHRRVERIVHHAYRARLGFHGR